MANIKSAVKRAKQADANHLRNRSVKSSVLTARKKVLEAISTGNKEEAQKLYSAYSSKLDKASKKGVVPKNTANRKKSRVALSIAKMA
ncbi:MAG: 30S ribosomal protein S20 [Kiritimatiellia bacterium]|jgi:small subunit ribosomal protein S20|nr:30S ribosomal protein S20 [Kiritimatiellia bacterium]MDD4175117.1 30S ribosomal protein S20 [Kiritimatiellia bacterium]MDD4443341.1 30S ribosomal protein S20 [Kiritimatiellia bacterium]MDX9794423.1 30S ribosomal protein S20 [Kiritimatiellia bacterium]NLC81109.1 30S ribosomal protein S20 [Lentisphaerota bacterium]